MTSDAEETHSTEAAAEARPAEEPSFPADWGTPRPEVIPRATYFPAAMAFGLTLFFWGLVTSPVVFAVGFVVVAVSLAGWVREMRHEQ